MAIFVTLIVLLILAGASINAVVGKQGIFNKVEQGAESYNRGKAREKLELTLNDAQIIKYTEGLTDEQLTDKINEIGEEIEERENLYISQAIIDGYIFLVDRTVPKILDYLGPADGVIITAKVSGNNGWIKPEETNISVIGKIKTYSGGVITNVTAKKEETPISNFEIDKKGRYVINNITSDTTIIITAEDSFGNNNSKTIPIKVRVDSIPPVIDTVDVKEEGLKISFNATGHDNESGLKHFNYTIKSNEDTTLEGIPTNKRTGIFNQGQTVEIVTTPTGDREETKYIISVVAIDNCNNSTSVKKEATSIDGLTITQAKELVNINTLQQYIGKRVIDYNPEKGGIWRVFYYDTDGYFGTSNALYLKGPSVVKEIPVDDVTDEGISMMKKMNPKWEKSTYFKVKEDYEKQIVWLCDPKNWKQYKTEYANYAIGCTSVEMYIRSYNVWKQNNPNGNALICKILNNKGYGVGSRRFLSTI